MITLFSVETTPFLTSTVQFYSTRVTYSAHGETVFPDRYVLFSLLA